MKQSPAPCVDITSTTFGGTNSGAAPARCATTPPPQCDDYRATRAGYCPQRGEGAVALSDFTARQHGRLDAIDHQNVDRAEQGFRQGARWRCIQDDNGARQAGDSGGGDIHALGNFVL